MMRKMRGIIDPFTLGFLLSIIGTTSAYLVHNNQQIDDPRSTSNQIEQHDNATQLTLSNQNSEN